MSNNILKFKVIVLFLIFSVVTLAGCSKPPTQEMAKAEKAMDDAKQKEAHLYVFDLFKKAEESLKTAKDLVTSKKYKEAKQAAEQTIQIAQQAIALVETNKAKMKAEVEQMLQDSQKEIDELKSLAAKAIRKKTFTAREEIQGMIGKWEIDLLNIKEKLQGQQVKQAFDETKAVKEQVANHKQKVEEQIPAKPEKK